ncbi:MAG: DUF2807 domain-containing protein [Bacteroidales bacterium]
MNVKSILIALVSVMLAFSAQAQLFKKVTGNDKYVTREYKLNDFSKVNISHAFNVIYKVNPDSAGMVRVYGEENILDLMSLKSEKGILSIKLTGLRDPEFGVILIHMYSNSLISVKNEGAGTFEIQSPLDAPEISLSVIGSGQIKAERLDCGVLNLNVGGGDGDIAVKSGKVGFGDYSIQGNGEIRAQDVDAESASAVITGTGVIRLTAQKDLKTILTGSGKVYYNGKPQLKSRTVGTGQVLPL